MEKFVFYCSRFYSFGRFPRYAQARLSAAIPPTMIKQDHMLCPWWQTRHALSLCNIPSRCGISSSILNGEEHNHNLIFRVETPNLDVSTRIGFILFYLIKRYTTYINSPEDHKIMNKTKFTTWLIKNITLHQHDSRKEEIANGVTHGVGILLSIFATILMISRVIKGNSAVSMTGAIIFGLSMILLYSSSTFYHLSRGPVAKRLLRIMDHSSIYLLIAGTYTPVALTVGGGAGWAIFGIEWGLTIIGIAFTLIFWGKYGFLHVLFYIIMGWMAVFIWKPLMNAVNTHFLLLMISGGLSYTLGTVIYGLKKIPYYHAIWHLFVLTGSMLLFLSIYMYLM